MTRSSKYRLITGLMLSVAAFVTCGPAVASQMYSISFTPIYSIPTSFVFTASGSFIYDPSAGFSDFIVTANGINFDLTASANNPSATELDACQGNGLTGAAYSFELLTVCSATPLTVVNGNGSTGIGAGYDAQPSDSEFYIGGPDQALGTGFAGSINEFLPTGQSGFVQARADLTVTATAIPEPSGALLFGLPALALIVARRRPVLSRSR